MKSSACKFVLDKVSKFEKKYSKPFQKIKSKEEFIFKDDDENSVFSESLNDQVKAEEIKESPSIHKNPFEFSIIDVSKPTTHSTSFQKSSEANGIAKLTLMPKNNNRMNSTENKFKRTNAPRKSFFNFSSDNAEHLSSVEEMKFDIFAKESNKSIMKEFDPDPQIFTNENAMNFVQTEDKTIADNKLKMPVRVEASKEGFEKDCSRMSLNIKLYEDPNEVSDMSSKGVDNFSLQSTSISEDLPFRILTIEDLVAAEESKSEETESKEKKTSIDDSESIPQRIFAFEDLITLEELEAINKESKNNLKDKENSDEDSHKTETRLNSQIKSSSQHSGIEQVVEDTQNMLVEENAEEILSNKEHADESSIIEDIEEIENSVNENSYELAERHHSHLEEILQSGDVDTDQKQVITKNNEKESGNVFRSFQMNDSLSSVQSISVLLGETNDNTGSFQVKETNKIHKIISSTKKKISNCHQNKETKFYEKVKPSDKDIRLAQDQNLEETLKQTNHTKKRHRKREEELKTKSKLKGSSKVVSQIDLLCHASTQTNYLPLSETYEFEKRMDAIMKTSFNYMADTTNLQLEMDKNFTDHNSHIDISTASSWTPLERGFHCALKQQVELTKHFVQAEYNMYAVCMTAIKEMSATYKPATLHYNKKMKNKQKYK